MADDLTLDQRTPDERTPDERTELETRGRLVIKERAVARVAVAAASAVDGVTRTKGGLTMLTGRELPRADVSVGENSVAVNLYIGVLWPSRVSDTAAAVHNSVSDALTTITGLPLHRMNVLVTSTTASGDPAVSTAGGVDHVPLPTRAPTASPAAVPVALLLAVAALGIAFVAGREFLVGNDTIGGAPWVQNTVDAIAGLHWEPWMLGAAVAAIVVGVVLVALALKPRARTHTGIGRPGSMPGSVQPTVWMRPTDLARVCSDAAQSVSAVVSARTVVTKRRIVVHVVRTTSDASAVDESVRDALASTLAIASDARQLRVDIEEERR